MFNINIPLIVIIILQRIQSFSPFPATIFKSGFSFRGYIALFNQGRVTELWPLFTMWPFFGGRMF